MLAMIGVSGCEPAAARATDPASPDVLVLELGGERPSLRAALLRLAGQAAPPPAVTPPRTPPPSPPVVPEPLPSPPPQSEPRPAAERSVRLPAGGTLYALAREHLGDPNRWREIATLNGWSEDDAARLAAGVAVKLPPR